MTLPTRLSAQIVRTPITSGVNSVRRVRWNFNILAEMINALMENGFIYQNAVGVWSIAASSIIPGPINPEGTIPKEGVGGSGVSESFSSPPAFLHGSAEPAIGLGKPGDMYFQTSGIIWTKVQHSFGIPPYWYQIINLAEFAPAGFIWPLGTEPPTAVPIPGPQGLPGTPGALGAQGGIGPAGATGPTGPVGSSGGTIVVAAPSPAAFLYGSADPDMSLGKPGDMYFQTSGIIWAKVQLSFGIPPYWHQVINLAQFAPAGFIWPLGEQPPNAVPIPGPQGPMGPTGPHGPQGSAAPGAVGPAANYTSSDTVPNNTTWAVNWTTVSDPSGFLANNTQLVAPAAGYYLLSCYLHWASNASGFRITEWRINGSNYQNGLGLGAGAANTDDVRNNVQAVLYLQAGDYVEMAVFQDSGGSLGFILATAAIVQLKAGV